MRSFEWDSDYEDYFDIPKLVWPEGQDRDFVMASLPEEPVLQAFRISLAVQPLPEALLQLDKPGIYFVDRAGGVFTGYCSRFKTLLADMSIIEQISEAHHIYGLTMPEHIASDDSMSWAVSAFTALMNHTAHHEYPSHGHCHGATALTSRPFALTDSEHFDADGVFVRGRTLLTALNPRLFNLSDTGHGQGREQCRWDLYDKESEQINMSIAFCHRVGGYEVIAGGREFNDHNCINISVNRGSTICHKNELRPKHLAALASRMLKAGTLEPLSDKPGLYLLKEDALFSSHADASAFVSGVSEDGRGGWNEKEEKPRSYVLNMCPHELRGWIVHHKCSNSEIFELLSGSEILGPKFKGQGAQTVKLKQNLIDSGGMSPASFDGTRYRLEQSLFFKRPVDVCIFIFCSRKQTDGFWEEYTRFNRIDFNIEEPDIRPS